MAFIPSASNLETTEKGFRKLIGRLFCLFIKKLYYSNC